MVAQTQSQEEAVRCFEMYCRAKGLAESTVKMYSFALDRLGRYLSDEAKSLSIPSRDDLRGFTYSPDACRGAKSPDDTGPDASHPRLLQLPGAGEPGRGKPDSRRRDSAGSDRHAGGPVCSGGRAPLSCCEEAIMVWDWELCDARCVSRHWPAPRRTDRSRRERHRCRQCRHPSAEWQGLKGAPRARRAGSCAELRDWIEVRPHTQVDVALFTTLAGRRLDKRYVAWSIERTARNARLDGRCVHPHLLRHAFATQYIMNGGDPFSLQKILGRSDITTMIYANLAGVGLRGAHAKASSVGRSPARD